MTSNPLALRRWLRPFLATALLGAALAPAEAAVTTVFNCPSSGHGGNRDSIFNGFFVQNVPASNLHSATLYYTTSQNGTYNVSITVRRNSYNGPVLATATQNISLTTNSTRAVTWEFPDPSFPNPSTLFFTHTQNGGSGTVYYNMQPDGTCPASQQSVGTSSNLNGFNVAVQLTTQTTPSPGFTPCAANATTLCLDDQPGDKRFQVRVTYSSTQGGGLSGNGRAISLAPVGVSRGGLFWFFGADNPEMLVKVLNGCSLNNRFWVFYSAGTNVGFQVRVTDMMTGNVATYNNPDLTAAPPVQDTNALACS